MQSVQDTQQKIAKRLFDNHEKTVVDINASELSPASSAVTKKPKLSAATSSLLCHETLDSLDDLPSLPAISLAKPKLPSPQKKKSLPRHRVSSLDNEEQIIAWIIGNKRFLIASFCSKLDEWVNNKLIADPSFLIRKNILVQFTEEFHSAIQSIKTVDVRKLELGTTYEWEDLFPDAYACFIDAVNGLTYDLERNTDLLSNRNNNLLREFLLSNRLVAECLAYGLPTLNDIAELWAKEHPKVDLWSRAAPPAPTSPKKVAIKSPTKSPGKSPVKSVGKDNPPDQENLFNENKRKHVNLLADSMNSFLTHVTNSESLRKPIDNAALDVNKPEAYPNVVLPAILRRSRNKSVY